MDQLEDYIATGLAGLSFGESVETFELGFDLAELEGWGDYFTSTSRYITYRPGKKLLLSVGQLDWPDVKDLDAHAQFVLFSNTLLQAVARISDMKRKPRDFNVSGFLDRLQRVLADCPVADVTVRLP